MGTKKLNEEKIAQSEDRDQFATFGCPICGHSFCHSCLRAMMIARGFLTEEKADESEENAEERGEAFSYFLLCRECGVIMCPSCAKNHGDKNIHLWCA